jgi:hypothetical protein
VIAESGGNFLRQGNVLNPDFLFVVVVR